MNYNTFMTMQIPFDGLFETFYDNGKKKLEAEYKYGKLNGKFGIWDLDNIKIKEGIYKNDILVSLTKYTYQNNALTVSNFKDSWLHGSQIEYFENGQKKIEVTYKKALIIGKKSEWDENGNLESEVIYDKYEGDDYDQKEYFSMNSSKKIDSKFEGDNIHLWANWLNADQTEYTDKLLNANRVVKKIFWYPNGNKAEEVNFLRCYPNGKTIAWYENGEIFADENYKNNRKHGKWTYWYQGGQLYYEENYKEGLKDGEWLYFDSLGNKTDVKNYKSNRLLSWDSYDEQGNTINKDEELAAENKANQPRQSQNNHSDFDSDIPWIDQQSLTDDEKRLGESFWRDIL